jgi:hypothetical protein
MSKKIEEIFLECIEAIKAGQSDIDGCLRRYPSLREELEPLLNIAISLREPPDVRPSQEFKIRARVSLMDHIYADGRAKKISDPDRVASAKGMAYSIRLKAMTVALAVAACLFGLGGGLAYASQDSLPGDNLYPIKLAAEQIRRVITVNDVDEVRLELELANTRLGEMSAVAYRGYEPLSTAIDGYENNINLALENAEKIGDALKLANTLEMLALATSDHIDVIDLIEDAAVEGASYRVQRASEIAFNAHVRALRGLAVENAIRAAEINLATIESRLSRARTKAEENRMDEAEAALSQFQVLSRLGEEISQISRGVGNGSAQVDELNARATAAHLEVLSIIYGKTSEQTRDTVEDAMADSVEVYDQAVKGLQEKGILNDIPEEPPIPEDIPGDVKERILKPEPKGSSNGSGDSGDGPGGSGNGPR